MLTDDSTKFLPHVPTYEDKRALDAALDRLEQAHAALNTIEHHRAHGCRWWRRGVGQLVAGEWVESPDQVLIRREP